MEIVVYLVLGAVGLLFAYLVARSADKRGFSFWVYFTFSLVGTPVLAYITLRVADNLATEKEARTRPAGESMPPTSAPASVGHEEQAVRPSTAGTAPAVGESPPEKADSTIDRIRELKRLRDERIISETEFRKKKRHLLRDY